MPTRNERIWSSYGGPGARVIAKRCACVRSSRTVVVICSVSRKFVGFYFVPDSIYDLLDKPPQAWLNEELATIRNIYRYLHWQDAINVYEFVHRLPFWEQHQAVAVADRITKRLHMSSFPGWTYTLHGRRGLGLLKDFGDNQFGGSFCVEIADDGIAIYDRSMADGCTLSPDERTMLLQPPFAEDIELRHSQARPYVEEIVNVHRSFMRWWVAALVEN